MKEGAVTETKSNTKDNRVGEPEPTVEGLPGGHGDIRNTKATCREGLDNAL